MEVLTLVVVAVIFLAGMPALAACAIYLISRPDILIARNARLLELERGKIQNAILEDERYARTLERAKEV